jgi:hypothetical protein
VIAMQVADEYLPTMIDANAVVIQLHLRTFSTVNDENLAAEFQNLRAVVPTLKWASAAIA